MLPARIRAPRRRARHVFALLVAPALGLAGCGEGTPGVTDPVNDSTPATPDPAALAQVLMDGGAFSVVQDERIESPPEEFEQTSGNDQYFCTRQRVSLTQGYSDYPQFDPNSQVIFPGNLLQGNTLDDATPSGIPVERGPGTIVITLVNGASSASRQLDEVGLGSVYDAMNQIIADNPGDLPARTTYSMERISSVEQLGVSIRAEYQDLSTEVKGSFSYESDVRYNRYLVKLTQSYYTIAFEPPTSPADFFGDGVTATQLSQYVQPGNPAAYVSSVTYGRSFYLLIQSSSSVQEMEASIDASFKGAVAGGGIGGDVKYVSELSEVKISGYAIGGDAGQAAAALTGDFTALQTFIAEGGTITTGQPLSYTVNAANDPARQLEVKVATDYDVVDCSPLGDALPDGVAWFRSTSGVSTVDVLGGRGVTRWADLFGAQRSDNSRDATVPFGGPTSAGLHNLGAPGGGRVVSFQFNSTAFTGQMVLPGTALTDTDYTIMAVLRRTGLPPSDPQPTYWTWGESQQEGRGIRIGFDNDSTLSVTHGGSTGVTAPVANLFGYHLFTITFSQTDGMRVFIDGIEEAHDPTLTAPLQLFRGARMGVADASGSSAGAGFAVIDMLEYQIYDFVPTEAQRRAVERGLMERYQF